MKNQLNLLLLLSVLFSSALFGQRIIRVSITASDSLEIKKIKLNIEDGMKEYEVKPLYLNNSIIISKGVYSKYPVLWVLYPRSAVSFWTKGFLISDSTASVEFTSRDSSGNPIAYCESNIIEYNKLKGYKEFQDFTLLEQKVLDSIYTARPNSTANRDSLRELENRININYFNKKLKFVETHNNLYFSFLLFKEDIIPNLFFCNADTMIKVYNGFAENIKNSFEGREVLKYLEGRVLIKKSQHAPVFITKDIHGRKVSLTNFRGDYVLISFWASWCGPCIKELPVLKKIQKDYYDRLRIISVSYDQDSSAFAKALKKYDMNWINIFGDDDLINKYGRTPIPALYLLDKDGKVLYNSFEDNTDELLSLIKDLIK